MTVWIDKAEKGGMRSLVADACAETRESSDFGADYVAGGFAIERKRWDEVAGRMTETDAHLFHQVDKLTQVAEALDLEPALLLEGELGSEIFHSGVRADRVAKYLSGLPVMGVTVVPSTGPECSAQILARLESGAEPDVRRVRGAPGDGVDAQRFVVEGVPGVGPSTAEALLDELGSPRAVATASEAELRAADGVGPATAGKVREAFGPKGQD